MTATLPPATAPAQAITPRAWRVLAVTSLGVLIVLLDTTFINIAFPAITAAFPSTTRAALSWVLNAYAIVFAALLITAGRTADQLGRRRMFLIGLAVFAATSAACGLAPTLPALVAGRALQAVGAALLVPTSLALLLTEFPRSRRSMAVGLWGAVGAVAAAGGPLLGALLVETIGWRWIFLANPPVCTLAIATGGGCCGNRPTRRPPGSPTCSAWRR